MFGDIFAELNAQSVCLAALVIGVCAWCYRHYCTGNHPPGPWGYPIVGHLPMFGPQPHETFMKLRKKYGDVFSIRIGSFPTVVVNGKEAIREALVTSSGVFDDRPRFLSFTVSPHDRTGFAPYSPRWVVYKSIVVKALQRFMKDKDQPLDALMSEESACFVNDILSHNDQPFNPREDFFVTSCSLAYQLCYGKGEKIRSDSDFKTFMRRQIEFITFVSAGNPVEVMPWLSYVMPWKAKRFYDHHKFMNGILGKKISEHRESYIADSLRDITDVYLSLGEETPEMKQMGIKGSDLFGSLTELIPAAFDTSATALLWLCLFLVKHPDIQTQVQNEIDREVGTSRVLSTSTRARLPYTEATLLESMRLRTAIPTALPHAAYKDGTLCGYNVRKGTVVMINLHSVTRDPDTWIRPEEFYPGHFLNDDGTLNTDKTNAILPFGLGVRKCPGEALAKTQLMAIFTTLMQRFTLRPVHGETYDTDGISGLSYYPKPYRLIASLR